MSDENQTRVNTQEPQKKAPIMAKTKYIYNVYQIGFYRAPIFELEVICKDPEKVKRLAMLIVAQNVADPKLYTLELKSIVVLDEVEVPNAEPKN